MFDLSNKTALVTGASRGIGRATALALASAGAHVVVHYGKSAEEANGVVAEIRLAGGKADAVGADMGLASAPAELAKAVKAIVGERLDILVANAGTANSAALEDQTVEDFDRVFAVNVRGPYFLLQQLSPLLGDGSSVVLVSSLAAGSVVGDLSAYAATKGATDTLVKFFASALGSRGVRVNAVAPGVIDTELSSFARTEQGKAFVLGIQALQRVGQPDDVADVIAFLASNGARWITGATIPIDGGSKL